MAHELYVGHRWWVRLCQEVPAPVQMYVTQERDRETERDAQTHRHTDRHAHRHTQAHTHRDTQARAHTHAERER
eukprot:COSAG03_NODE_1365_length_4249_cov_274.827952_4_plen_74_part_00